VSTSAPIPREEPSETLRLPTLKIVETGYFVHELALLAVQAIPAGLAARESRSHAFTRAIRAVARDAAINQKGRAISY